jgi:hypothetical protein
MICMAQKGVTKMKTRMFMIVALIAALFALAAPVRAHAENTRIYFTGSEWCDPNSLIFGRAWMSGPNFHANGITQVCYDTASIPQLIGTAYLFDGRIVVNGLELYPISGKYRMESNEGGVWTGSWILPANSNIIRLTAHGEGKYEGLQLHLFEDDSAGSFWGYIDTGG